MGFASGRFRVEISPSSGLNPCETLHYVWYSKPSGFQGWRNPPPDNMVAGSRPAPTPTQAHADPNGVSQEPMRKGRHNRRDYSVGWGGGRW